jgi:hypothetical protein
MSVETVEFGDSEVEPIVGSAPSLYDATVVTFDDSEVDVIVARPPAQYDRAIAESPLAEDPVTAEASRAATAVIFDDSEVETIVGRAPAQYTSVVFDDTEVEPIFGRRSTTPYDDVRAVAKVAEIRIPPPQTPYAQTLAVDVRDQASSIGMKADGYQNVIPRRQVDFIDQPEVIVGHVPQRVPAGWFERQPILSGHISFELSDAWDLPRPTGAPAGLSPAQLQVMGWLRAHLFDIVDVEKRRHIDRRAISAAVAWEALENVWPVSLRAVGPGKVHADATVVRQVEGAGYLPARTLAQRRNILRSPRGALDYIGAIMQAQADVAWSFGRNIRTDVGTLANEYQGRDLSQWRDHLKRKDPGTPLVPGNTMGVWAAHNLPYLEAAVGLPDPLAVESADP